MADTGVVARGRNTPQTLSEQVDSGTAELSPDPDRPNAWLLRLNGTAQSHVDLDDPTHLEFEYVQRLGHVVDLMAPPNKPLRALHLGGGGFTVPAYVEATRPGSDQLVLELDGGLVDLDKRELGLRTGPKLRTRIGDARVGLAEQAADASDLVVGDAFGHLVVPWHLATREMAADISRTLREGGIYAQNGGGDLISPFDGIIGTFPVK